MTNKQRQYLLGYLGYYGDSIDGEWGPLSRRACTAFQRDRGIAADGCGGQETDSHLKAAVAKDWVRMTQQGSFWDEIQYWTREEFRCQCGGKYCNGFPTEPDPVLVHLLEDVRGHFGRPGYRSSGLRCKTWNAIQGGVPNSRHINGKAMDFRIEGHTAGDVLNYVNQNGGARYAYAIDGTYVHVDVE